MSGANKRKGKRVQTKLDDIPMTPMIDVVFQLLIYFIFTFEPIDVFAHLQVYRPAADKSATSDSKPPNIVRITVFSNGYTVNEKRFSKEGVGDLLFQLADMDRNQTIMIICTAASPHKNLVELLDMCTEAKLSKFSIISTD
jgi:biopolymer transport protein ExbD